jgi:hypothetical protein
MNHKMLECLKEVRPESESDSSCSMSNEKSIRGRKMILKKELSAPIYFKTPLINEVEDEVEHMSTNHAFKSRPSKESSSNALHTHTVTL